MTITTTQSESKQAMNTDSTSIIRSFQRMVPDYHPAHPNLDPNRMGMKQLQNIPADFNNPNMADLTTQDVHCESSTQTLEVTNLNVISNIKLSQPTLDLIFSHVMSDLQTKLPQVVTTKARNANLVYDASSKHNLASPSTKQVRLLSQNEPRRQIADSNKPETTNSDLRLGSKSSKTSKMFVSMCPVLMKTSSADAASDNDSDDSSLVDSLEDSVYSESDVHKGGTKWKRRNKPTTFFIPIEVSEGAEVKSVSEHLPERVRDRLVRRHQLRQQRQQRRRSRQRTNANEYPYGKRFNLRMRHEEHRTTKLPELNDSKQQAFKNTDTSRKNRTPKASISTPKSNRGASKTSTKQTCYIVKERDRLPRSLSPINSTSRRPTSRNVGDTYNKIESTRRIELLNIVECSMSPQEISPLLQGNSRIPVLINNKQPNLHINIRKHDTPQKPDISESKIDQLIANILINTQTVKTKETLKSYPVDTRTDVNAPFSPKKWNSRQKWDMRCDQIPGPIREHILRFEDEVVKTNTHYIENTPGPKMIASPATYYNQDDDKCDSDSTIESTKKISSWSTYKGRAAVDAIGDENFLAIPKGWITFYMLHESTTSPCSNSDEGKQDPLSESDAVKQKSHGDNCARRETTSRQMKTKFCVNRTKSHQVRTSQEPTNVEFNVTGNSTVQYKSMLPSLHGEDHLKRSYEHRKMRYGTPERKQSAQKQNKWQITVSGLHNSRSCPSDLEMHLRVSEYVHCRDSANIVSPGLVEGCVCDRQLTYFPKIDGTQRDEMSQMHKRMEHESRRPSNKQLPHISKGKNVGYKMT